MPSSDVPYFRTVEHVLQWCPILQDSGACPPVVPHTSGPANSGTCPPVLPYRSGPANSCMADGHPTAHKAALLPAGTSENGPIYLDQRPASVITWEGQEERRDNNYFFLLSFVLYFLVLWNYVFPVTTFLNCKFRTCKLRSHKRNPECAAPEVISRIINEYNMINK